MDGLSTVVWSEFSLDDCKSAEISSRTVIGAGSKIHSTVRLIVKGEWVRFEFCLIQSNRSRFGLIQISKA